MICRVRSRTIRVVAPADPRRGAEGAGLARGPASGFIVRGAMAPVACAGEIGRLLPAR